MSIQADRIIAVRTGKTVYRDGETVLKVFDSDYSKADILNEALNQARVEETGICVPKLLEVTKLEDRWTIRSEYIPGKTLARLMEESPEKEEEYLELFASIQADIFHHESPELPKLKDKMCRKIGQSDLDATTRYDLYTRLDSMPTHRKICHGDFNPSNIMIRPDGVPVILDWSHATQGNASADAARTYLLFSLAGKGELAERYLTLFCDKTGTALHYVQRWMPIVAASQLVKEKPEEREFLMKWVSVVDYE